MVRLNLPILERLSESDSILIAGIGGGFDIFCGLPIYFDLVHAGKEVHLANLSFTDGLDLMDGEELTNTCIGVTIDISGRDGYEYFPEYYLAEWFFEELGEEVTIWCFEKTGARPLVQNYRALIEHLEIDAIVLVDGGVDSLNQGNEPQIGTMLEDSLSLLAVKEQKLPVKLLACVGMGIETEMSYGHIFENVSSLIQQGAFRGSCSLTGQMQSYRYFEQATLYAFDQQPNYPSVICASIISAVRGHYGNYHMTQKTAGSQLNISSLMPIYWFFDAASVAQQNILLPQLRLTYTIDEAWKAMQTARFSQPEREAAAYPLP